MGVHHLGVCFHLDALHVPCQVSFRDVHFGSCPVCDLRGYRTSVVLWLKKLHTLDGCEVTEEDRERAQDVYLGEVFEFNQKVEELQREYEREMHSIEQQRERIVSHSSVLQQDMLRAFEGLEGLIQNGREQIALEHKRQVQVRVTLSFLGRPCNLS